MLPRHFNHEASLAWTTSNFEVALQHCSLQHCTKEARSKQPVAGKIEASYTTASTSDDYLRNWLESRELRVESGRVGELVELERWGLDYYKVSYFR